MKAQVLIAMLEHSPKFGETKPHVPHEDMLKLTAKEHDRLAGEHTAHSKEAASKKDRDLAAKHDDTSYMHRSYAAALRKQGDVAKHIETAKRYHGGLSK